MEIVLRNRKTNESISREIDILKILTDREGYYFVEEIGAESDFSIENVAFIAEFKFTSKVDYDLPSYIGLAAFYFDNLGVLICNPISEEPDYNFEWTCNYNSEQLINYVDYKKTCDAMDIGHLSLRDFYKKKKAKCEHSVEGLYRN